MSTTLYGIANCDTVRKAKKWLSENSIDFHFHDFRKDGIDAAWLEDVAGHIDWTALLNKRGTTFRQLADEEKADLNKDKAIALMTTHPAMIKRPVLSHNGAWFVGFSDATYRDIFAHA